MPSIGVDFDGVIHRYSRGWLDGTIYDDPVEGAFDALDALRLHAAVFIFTTRDVVQVTEWMASHGQPVIDDRHQEVKKFWDDRHHMLVTNRKLGAIAYIDDRAIRFTNWIDAIKQVAALEVR